MNPWQKFVQFLLTFRHAFASMRRGRLWIPFLLYALVEVLLVAVVYFGVRPPLADFFAGPLSFMVPDAFFHYPAHLALLPAVFYRLLIPFGALLESLLIAAATLMFIRHIKRESVPATGSAVSEVKFGYWQFVIFWVLTFALLYAFQTLYGGATGQLWAGYAKRRAAVGVGEFIGSTFFNALLAYATAIIVYERTSLWRTLVRSLRVFFDSPVYTFCFVLFGSLLTYPLATIMGDAADWMGRFNPEVMLLLVFANIVLGVIASFVGAATLAFWYIQRQEVT